MQAPGTHRRPRSLGDHRPQRETGGPTPDDRSEVGRQVVEPPPRVDAERGRIAVPEEPAGGERRGGDGVVAQHGAKLGITAPVPVPDDPRRVEGEAKAGAENPRIHVVVVPGAGGRPRPEILGEESGRLEDGAAEDRVRSGADAPGGGRGVDEAAVVDLPGISSAEAAVALEQDLRPRLELERADKARDSHQKRVGEIVVEAVEPARVDHAVVVGERDRLAPRL